MSDYLYYCAKCNSLIADKYEDDDVPCDDCWGKTTPLHITEDEWGSMTDVDKTALLEKYRNPQPQVQKKRASVNKQQTKTTNTQKTKKVSNKAQTYETPEKDYYDRISGLSITSFVLSFFIGVVGIILGIIDLTKDDGRKKGLSIAAISIGGVSLIALICLSIFSFSTGSFAFGKSEAVKNVEQMIADIGTVTLDSGGRISEAETAYESLSEENKSKVSNYYTLLEARSKFDSLGIKITLDNYEKYLSVSCKKKLSGAIDFGQAMGTGRNAGTYVYTQIDFQLEVSGKSKNYDYNDVIVTAKINGHYVPFSQDVEKKINKGTLSLDEYYKSHMEPLDLTLIANTDILGNGTDTKSISIPSNYWVMDSSATTGFEIVEISGTMTPVN